MFSPMFPVTSQSDLTYGLVEDPVTGHPLADIGEGIGDDRIIAKVGPSVSSCVATVVGQSVASQEEQQQGHNGERVELHVDVCCFCSIFRRNFINGELALLDSPARVDRASGSGWVAETEDSVEFLPLNHRGKETPSAFRVVGSTGSE